MSDEVIALAGRQANSFHNTYSYEISLVYYLVLWLLASAVKAMLLKILLEMRKLINFFFKFVFLIILRFGRM